MYLNGYSKRKQNFISIYMINKFVKGICKTWMQLKKWLTETRLRKDDKRERKYIVWNE
jgi:hypothetical protein